MRRRRPVVLSRKLLLKIFRMKRNGADALCICQALDCPYEQVLRTLHPHLNRGEQVVVPADQKRNPFPRQVA
jgi:hypothetical protein